ncbi:MAG TPA: hypothetical protein VGB68_04140 [Pyrinomonadaceae bacterium]
MGWLLFIICIAPLYLLYNTGQPIIWVITLVNAIANLWSYGVMHNYAVQSSAKKIKQLQENLALEGRLNNQKQSEIDRQKLDIILQAVPNWLANVNILTFLIGIGFLGYGIWLLI